MLKRILLVDDNPHDREMALEALRHHNLANSVVSLRDGVEALDYLYRRGEFAQRVDGNPAVILLDLKMPRVDGLEVLQKIKSDPALKAIPVVIMTSSREEQDLVKSYELGVYNEWTLAAQERINKYRPGLYAKVHEVPYRGSEFFATSSVVKEPADLAAPAKVEPQKTTALAAPTGAR